MFLIYLLFLQIIQICRQILSKRRSHLVPDERTIDLASVFDPMMDFSYPYFSKAWILQLSEDLTHARTTLIREEHPMDYTDHPVCVLLLTAMDQINPDEHGQ